MDNKEGKRCYVYTRVSTIMQVDGYSLDAQENEIMEYIKNNKMIFCGKYTDAGKSGMDIEGRNDFQRMLDDIETGKDKIDYVVVYKLSRFGRSTTDMLESIDRIKEYGVNLVCAKEPMIDTAIEGIGKVLIAFMASIAESEHDNIIMQTYAGKVESVRQGNRGTGAQAPFGYKLVYNPETKKNELKINEEEAEIVRLIFDKYVNTNMGFEGIEKYLESQGITKVPRQNSTLHYISKSMIKNIITNELYYGKIPFGKRKTVKLTKAEKKQRQYEGKKYSRTKTVTQKDYQIFEGKHEAIISEELFNKAKEKHEKTGVKNIKIHSLDHEHLLSGICKCPICGAPMFANINRKKRKDGTLYKDYFSYRCYHRQELEDGTRCTFKKQYSQEKVNNAVYEIIKKMVANKKFAGMVQSIISDSVSTDELDREIVALEKDIKKLTRNKDNLSAQIDNLDIDDELYDDKYNDMTKRLDSLYSSISTKKKSLDTVKIRKQNVEKEKITTATIYEYLLYFDCIYNTLTDKEKKEMMMSLVDEVQLYPEEREDGKVVKSIKFKFPICYDNENNAIIRWDNEMTVETVVLLSQRAKDHIFIDIELDDIEATSAETSHSYREIQEWILEKYGVKIHNLYIAQVKDKLGLEKRLNYNVSKKENQRVPQVTKEKEEMIIEAFKHFKMI